MRNLKSISKECKNDNLDSHHLRELLESISEELEVPFLERRLRSKTVRHNCEEELKDILSELCEKEKELLAAIGIANMLLDRNETLDSENLRLIESEENLAAEANLLRQELSKSVEGIRREEQKYKVIADALVATENELLKASCSLQIGKREPFVTKDIFNEDVQESKEHLRKEVDRKDYLGSLIELQNNYQNALSGKELVEAELGSLIEKYKKAHAKHKKANKKIKECEKINKVILESKENADKLNKKLVFENSKLKEKCEYLQDNLNLYENLSISQRSKQHTQNASSLFVELRSVEFSNEDSRTGVEDAENDLFTYTECLMPSTLKDCKIIHCESLGICGKEDLRDFSEEYFILTTQAIKMNSQHMESICSVPHKALYEKAIKDQIPFYKWSSWIERELNNQHIESIEHRAQGFSKTCKY